MNNGVLIYAHNSNELDYALMSVISGGLAKKYLNVPVSLVTDNDTVQWMKISKIYNKAKKIFDKIIEIDNDRSNNFRNLKDGKLQVKVPFKNASRSTAWNLTPYERTLMIDSDYLIFSDKLGKYWETDVDVMLSDSMMDVSISNRSGYLDRYVSDTGPHLFWATTVMFTKNEKSRLFFETVSGIKENYLTFSDVYGYDSRMFRNDIAFSISKHILDGFQTKLDDSLPPILTSLDGDVLLDITKDSRLILAVEKGLDSYSVLSVQNQDIHLMNKQSIVRNQNKLMKLI